MNEGSSHLKFIIGYAMFFLFITQMIGWGAPVFITEDFADTVSVPECEISGWSAPLDLINCFFSNLFFFFKLMTVSSSFLVIGTLLIFPLALGIIYIILMLIAVAIP